MASISLSVGENEKVVVRGLPEITFVRTGVQGEGACFLYALFTSMNAKVFKNLSIREQKSYVVQQRSDIARSITLEKWLSMSDGSLASVQISLFMTRLLKYIFTIVTKGSSTKLSPEIDKMIMDDVGIQDYFKTLGADKIHSKFTDIYTGKVSLEILDHVLSQDADMTDSMKNLLRACLELAMKTLLKRYKTELEDYNSWISDTTIHTISDYYKMNYLLITRRQERFICHSDMCKGQATYNIKGATEPKYCKKHKELEMVNINAPTYNTIYNTSDCQQMASNNRPFVLLYYIDERHYESMGVFDESTSNVTRAFYPESDIIQQLVRSC